MHNQSGGWGGVSACVRSYIKRSVTCQEDTDTEPAQICGCSCFQGPGIQTDNTNTHFALEKAFLVVRSGECLLQY